MKLIENLNWRYATKKYDSTQKVSDEDLKQLKEAIRLTPTSYGLQLFKVAIIESKELREQLEPASWGQKQLTEASHVLVFCNYTKFDESQVEDYIGLKSKTHGTDPSAMQGYGDFVKKTLAAQSDETFQNWTAKQTYIALGNLLSAAAELRIDATPIEGFEPAKYNEILGLTEKGLNAAVVATIGYRHAEDAAQFGKKVRKAEADLFVSL